VRNRAKAMIDHLPFLHSRTHSHSFKNIKDPLFLLLILDFF